MAEFIFDNTWILLGYIFKGFGINPFKRVGNTELHPTSSCQYWFQYIISFLVVILSMVFVIIFINFDTTNESLPTTTGFFQSGLYMTAFYGYALTMIGTHIIMIAKLKSKGKLISGVTDIQRYCNTYLEKNYTTRKKLAFQLHALIGTTLMFNIGI